MINSGGRYRRPTPYPRQPYDPVTDPQPPQRLKPTHRRIPGRSAHRARRRVGITLLWTVTAAVVVAAVLGFLWLMVTGCDYLTRY